MRSTSSGSFSQAYKTKMDIANAMNRLCEDVPFSRMKIEDIAKGAGISRSSFYYHFEDKNNVCQWLSKQFYARGLDQTGRSLTWFEGHLITSRYFSRFNTLLQGAEQALDYNAAVPTFMRHRQKTLQETITEFQHLELTPTLLFQIEALPFAEQRMSSLFRAGELGNMGFQEFARLMVSLVPKELYEALENPVVSHSSIPDFFFLE